MSKKVALITGITGQDGSYLAELLLENGNIMLFANGLFSTRSLSSSRIVEFNPETGVEVWSYQHQFLAAAAARARILQRTQQSGSVRRVCDGHTSLEPSVGDELSCRYAAADQCHIG